MHAVSASRSLPAHWDTPSIDRRRAVEERCAANRRRDNGLGNLRKPVAYHLLGAFLRLSGLYNRGYHNFLNPRLRTVHHEVTGWPENRDGFRLLQLSDLHIDLAPELATPVCNLLRTVHCDLCVLTGDFWDCSLSDHRPALPALQQVIRALPETRWPPYAVLGNHDTLALGSWLESEGLPVLLNETVPLHDAMGTDIALAGVDDAYLFQCDAVESVARNCPSGHTARILLSHSPQNAERAAAAGFHFQLSGHTHGGQIRLPGGRNVVRMPGIPQQLFDGPWQVGSLTGFTSRGTGGSHLPVRFHCPPEIVLHVLHAPGAG